MALSEGQKQRALILSLRLNENSLIKKCIFAINPSDIPAVASSIPVKYLQRLIEAFADLLESCPHLEFSLRWSQVCLSLLQIPSLLFTKIHFTKLIGDFMLQELCRAHGHFIQQNSRNFLPALRSLQKAITKLHQDLTDMCSSNEYLLRYLCSMGTKS